MNDDLHLHGTVYSPLVDGREAIFRVLVDSRQDSHLVSCAPSQPGLVSEDIRNGGINRST